MFGRGSRKAEYWTPRIKLAEKLGACVVTDLKQGAMFPTDHPAHYCPPFNALGQDARELLCEADVILALDWVDLGGALRQAKSAGAVGAKIVACSLDQNLHTGANMEYQALPPVDVAMASTADVVVAELNDALGSGRKDPWKVKVPAKAKAANGAAISMEQVAGALRDQFNDPENVTFCTLGRGWPFDVWPLQSGMAYLGKDGGGGLGSGPGPFGRLGAGAGRSGPLRHLDARRRRLLHGRDRDLERGAPSHSASGDLINNNRSYFNDELHQENVARTRGREVKNRWIGLRMEDPIAQHRQARRGAGRGRHRAGHQARRREGGDREGRRRAQEGRRLRDRFPHRSAVRAPGGPCARPPRHGGVSRFRMRCSTIARSRASAACKRCTADPGSSQAPTA